MWRLDLLCASLLNVVVMLSNFCLKYTIRYIIFLLFILDKKTQNLIVFFFVKVKYHKYIYIY